MRRKFSKLLLRNQFKYVPLASFAIIFALTGIFALLSSRAATQTAQIEPENGVLSGSAARGNDISASGTGYVQFKATSANGVTTYGGGPTGPLTTYTGPMTISTPTTISNVIINGQMELRAPVTMRNIRMNCTTDWACIRVNNSYGGSLDISDFVIDGGGTRSSQNSGGIIGGNLTVRRGEIFGVENGIVQPSDSLIEDVYIHDLQYMFSNPSAPGHPDAIQVDGGVANLTLRRLRLVGKPEDTSNLMIATTDGADNNITLDSIDASGAGVPIYLFTCRSGQPITNLTIINSKFYNPAYTGFWLYNCNPTNYQIIQQYGNTGPNGEPVTF